MTVLSPEALAAQGAEARAVYARLAGQGLKLDMTRGKPAPDIFLKAAAGLGVAPRKCLVFEDAPAGIAAAHAAGMRACALLTSHAREELADADYVAADFTGLSPLAAQSAWTPWAS